MKKLILAGFLMAPLYASATVDCEFTVTEVKVGEIGNNESKAFACDSAWHCYNLGDISADATKLRYSTAMTALVSGKKLRLRFYGESECSAAHTKMLVPNSTWLRN